MERSFARSMKSLDDVFAFVSDFFNSQGVSATTAFSIRFAIEELFTNLVKYNKNGKSDISVGLSVQGKNLVVQIKDIEEHPFDPTKAPDPDIHAPLENRRPGGLGIFLVKKMIDKVEYHHSENMSTITLVHSLEK